MFAISAALFAAAGCAGRVYAVDVSGAPISGARVVAVTPAMSGSPSVTNIDGSASAPRRIGGQDVSWIDVAKDGFESQHVTVGSRWPMHVVLAPAAPGTSPIAGPATTAEELLVAGMGLGDALELLTRHGIEFRIDSGEWGPVQQVAAAERFIVERRDIDDALIIYAESETGETMHVRGLHWWRNYQVDRELPKGLRKYEYTRAESLPVAKIEQQFSFALNPYDSDKVAAREENR